MHLHREPTTVAPDVTVDEAIKGLRQQATQKETIYYLYVTNEDRKLLGFVSLRHLILAPMTSLVGVGTAGRRAQ